MMFCFEFFVEAKKSFPKEKAHNPPLKL